MENVNKDGLAMTVLETLAAYQLDSEEGRTHVLLQKQPAMLAKVLGLKHWIREGGLNAGNISDFLTPYLEHSQHMHHPGYIGHQVAVPHKGAALADMIHGVINNPMAVYEMGPTASVCERVVVNWMLSKVGWFEGEWDDFTRTDTGGGVLTHGGSLANLTAVLAARARAYPDAWQNGTPENAAIIAPAVSHYSVSRAVSIAGFGQSAILPAPVTDWGVLRPEKLEETYRRGVEAGRDVFMVTANACSTATGLYDPIDEVADFCQAHGLWLHIDGAHGASALISRKTKSLLKGIARADSLVWDAHKMLKTSALCAAVLFKDQSAMAGTFSQKASYIFHEGDQIGFDVGPYALECTKAPLGTKLFLVLAMEGEAALGDFVAKQYADTQRFYEIIAQQEDFACPYKPQSNILCFRYKGVRGNAAQSALREAMLARGRFYITSAEVSGTRYLRLSVMNPRTTEATIRALLEEIRLCAKTL